MTRALAPGGYLFLGHTDSLGSRAGRPGAAAHPRHVLLPAAAGAARRRSPAAGAGRAAGRPAGSRRRPTGDDVYQRALALLRDERFAEALALIEPRSAGAAARTGCCTACCWPRPGRLAEADELARRLIDTGRPQRRTRTSCSASASRACGAPDAGRSASTGWRRTWIRGSRCPGCGSACWPGAAATTGTPPAELERALELLPGESEERITLFGGGFGRIALTVLCRSELDACGVRR